MMMILLCITAGIISLVVMDTVLQLAPLSN